MIKLYRKNELMFAIGCIVVYVVVCGNLRAPGDDNPYMTLGLLVMAALLFLFVKKNELMEEYGLSAWAKNSKQMLYFLPLWVLTTGNLWAGVSLNYKGMGQVYAIISMMLVGFVEEMIFRGFLFRGLLRTNKETTAIIISAVTFGIGHITNLLIGQEIGETLIQIVYAVALGFVFTLVYYKSASCGRASSRTAL